MCIIGTKSITILTFTLFIIMFIVSYPLFTYRSPESLGLFLLLKETFTVGSKKKSFGGGCVKSSLLRESTMGSDAAVEHKNVVKIEKKGKRGSKRRLPGLINHVLRRRIVQCERDLCMRGNHPEDGLEWFSAVSSIEQAPATAQTQSPASPPSPPSPVRQQHSAVAAGLCDNAAARDADILRQLNGMDQGKGDLPLDLARRLAVLAEQYQQQQQQYGNIASLLAEQACLEEMRIKRRRVYSDFATIHSPTSIDSVIHALAQAPRRPALDHGAFGRLLSAETVINDGKLLAPQPSDKPLPTPDLVLPPLSQALQLLRQDAEPRPFASPSHVSPGLDALALLSRNIPVQQDKWPANLGMNRVHEVQPHSLPLTQVQQHVKAALVQYLMRQQKFDSASIAMSPLLTAPCDVRCKERAGS
jgi:hypothetical protein